MKTLLIKQDLKKSLIKTPLIKELISYGAFVGGPSNIVHFSQISLFLAYRNSYSFYNIEISIYIFNKAVVFIKTIKQKKKKFVFVGTPPDVDNLSALVFNKIKVPFFANESWQPGFFSKSSKNSKRILVIYNINLNYIAFYEAVNAKVPVIGFATPYCDIRGLDYPVVLNLENSGFWYTSFCKTLLKK